MSGKDQKPDLAEAGRRIGKAKRSGAFMLDLYGLHLTAIPEAIASLTNIEILDLSHNQIGVIPDFLTKLVNLRQLYLNDNQLRTIPESVSRLSSLQMLYLADNRITTIPASLARLTSLRTLNLAGNQLSSIPESFRQTDHLAHLFLHGNAALGIPDEVLGPNSNQVVVQKKMQKLPADILSYYFTQRAGARPLNEAKLILVGRGGVGKTSLVKALTTGRFNSREKTTEGIKISDWACSLNRKERVTVHIWDFGGQEMMHATHQFFLTARSLYLLVLNRRQGGYDEEADYWFRLIRAFGGPDAPVVIALNKQGTEPFDVNRGGWLDKYKGNIRGFVETDCADLKSITRLKQKVQEQLRNLESLKVTFPNRWFAIKDELAHMRSDYVTFEDYRRLCARHGEREPARQNSLAGFLHDLGIALNYKDDPRLRFAYVLKPEWVTEGIYALLHAFVSAKGIFTPASAERVLGVRAYSDKAVHFILALMEQFELSFPLRDHQKRILIPQLLEDQQPDDAFAFNTMNCLNFGYRYPIIPEGLLPRFIVRTHHLSEPSTRWKSGVILKDAVSGCRALVRTDAPERQVRVHVDGPEEFRRDLLAIIRHNLEAIHADYEFQPQALVYLPGLAVNPLELDTLETLQRAGHRTIPVVLHGHVIDSDIPGLVSSVESPTTPLRLFLSYSHRDHKYIEQLRKQLKLMERNGLILPWHDRALIAGEKWEARILQELREADVIVCQLSSDFLASDFCVLTELDAAIGRKESGQAELIAYVLRDCGWKEVPRLAQFHVLPDDGKPISDWRSKDRYWRVVAEGIQAAVRKLQADRITGKTRGVSADRSSLRLHSA